MIIAIILFALLGVFEVFIFKQKGYEEDFLLAGASFFAVLILTIVKIANC